MIFHPKHVLFSLKNFKNELQKRRAIILQCKQLLFTKLINDPTMAIHVHWEIPICIKLKEK